MPAKTTRSKKRKKGRARKRSASTKLSKKSLLIFLFLILIVGFLPYSHSSITNMIEDLFSGNLKIQNSSLTPLRGVALKNVTFSHKFDDQSLIRLKLPTIRIRYSPLKILTNRKKVVKHLTSALKSGEINYLDSLIENGISEVQINKGHIDFVGSKGWKGVAEGVQAKLSVEQVKEKKLKGWVNVDDIKSGSFSLRDFKSTLMADGDLVTIGKLKGNFYEGQIGGEVTLNIRQESIAGGTISLDNLELVKMYADYPKKVGKLEGEADIRFKILKSSWKAEQLRARGKMYAKNVYAYKIPLLNTIVTTLTLPRLKSLRFKSLETDFELNGKVISVTNLSGRGIPMDITGGGQLNEKMEMDLDVEGYFPETFRDSLSTITWNALFSEENKKGRKFRCRIQGTYDEPWITVDRKHARKAVKNVFTSIGQSIGSVFKRDK